MAVYREAIEKLFVASTKLVLGGLAGLLCAVSPQGTPATLNKSGPTAAAAAPAVAAPPSVVANDFTLMRARAVPVFNVVNPDRPSDVQLVAARDKGKTDPYPEVVPETTWDGTPLPRAIVPPAPAPTQHQPDKAKTAPPAATVQPPEAVPPAVPEQWSPEEIAGALKECIKLLGPVAADLEAVEATKKGPCGAPAPVRLKSVGFKDKVEFSPPVEINCRMVVKLADWVEKALQPAASEMLSSRVVRISGASGYQCRNRYGLADAPLSEHALANAVDIPSFVLADGRSIKIAGTWGPTARDSLATADTGKPSTAPVSVASGKSVESAPKGLGTGKIEADKRSVAKSVDIADDRASGKNPPAAGSKVASLQKIGGGSAARGPEKLTVEGRFLHRVAKDACQTFGTVLGPEANEAHRDHFHLDLKPRRKKAFCE